MRSYNVLRGLVAGLVVGLAQLTSAAEQPNILVIWGDDIGISNLSSYSLGQMGYRTPNIDRIAKEGMLFTDYYGDQSCTAGRSSFITGQSPLRTGLTKVGIPGADIGLRKEDPTLAELLKPLGYMTGQFGKNHLGDKDEFLPSNHGFDEFFGNLYHLNAEEEPENEDYPQEPWFAQAFGPRGVIHSFADGKIEDSGPLTKKRMETIDDEFLAAASKFIDKSHAAKKPFFVWFNTTGMHYVTHRAEKDKGKSNGQGFYNDVMVAHDEKVGSLLEQLDRLEITENTIVIYSTDNGVHYNTWPDAGITPYRSEKNSNWEGSYRVPAMVRWPGKIKAGEVSNEIMSHLDWVPTLMHAAGVSDIAAKLKKGHTAGDKKFRVHLDGYDFLPYLTGQSEQGPRTHFVYFSDTGDLVGLRDGDWKMVFAEQRAKKFDIWREPYVFLRAPKLFHLRRDPFEQADENANNYNEWWAARTPRIMHGTAVLNPFLMSFKEFPPRQRPASFTVDRLMEQLIKWEETPY